MQQGMDIRIWDKRMIKQEDGALEYYQWKSYSTSPTQAREKNLILQEEGPREMHTSGVIASEIERLVSTI